MIRSGRLPELLSPAGDFECLLAAVKGGADAVYLGGRAFGARAYAKNFDNDELRRAVVYCHLHGVRIYVTMNTLLADSEMEAAVEFAADMYRIGVDALIVSDLGLIRQLRERVPDMELHASTQMSVHSTRGAEAAYDMGCKRVVPARELSAENIRSIVNGSRCEVEIFVHGALCVCYSGQCLFSSLVGGRSGNRGECAQPCRLPYNKGEYPLSLSDLSLAGHMKEVIASGVASLKIEGRMKSPEYVYRVTSIYRRLLDEGRNATRAEHEELRRVFSRGGFTDGYYVGKTEDRGMIGVRSESDKRATSELRESVYTPQRVKISAKAVIKKGEGATLTLIRQSGESATAVGDVVQAAKSAPLDGASVKARLAKMGNTFFSLDAEDIELELDDGVNMSPAALNELRRSAVSALESVGYEDRCDFVPTCGTATLSERVNVTPGLARTALIFDPALYAVGREYFDCAFLPLWRLAEYDGQVGGVYIPPVVTDSETRDVEKMLRCAKERGVRYALVGNIGHISMCREAGLEVVGDFRLNVMNRDTCRQLSRMGVDDHMLSVELGAPAVKRMGGRAVVYGRIPLMLTERCFMKENFGCQRCGACYLTDRKGVSFPMIREYPHRNLVLNSVVTYMGDKMSELRGARPVGEHYIFTTETAQQMLDVVSAVRAGAPLTKGTPFRRMGRREI